jgi:hypothetical protein
MTGKRTTTIKTALAFTLFLGIAVAGILSASPDAGCTEAIRTEPLKGTMLGDFGGPAFITVLGILIILRVRKRKR